MVKLTESEHRLLNEFQRDFPLTAKPYTELAKKLDCSEEEVIEQLKKLQEQKLISRIGAVVQPNTIGCSTLAAMSVPENNISSIVEIINQIPEVNHNYERENKMNIWFVVTSKNQDSLTQILNHIEQESGYKVNSFPMVRNFHIDLGFDLHSISH